VLAAREGIAQKQLGQLLALDTSTLTRTLRPLEKRGWIRTLPAEDLRQRRFALTPRGRRQLDRARPHWERIQDRVRRELGSTEWEEVMAALLRVTRAAEEM
jgi:DNA-binding MarR family transcriptional regulator